MAAWCSELSLSLSGSPRFQGRSMVWGGGRREERLDLRPECARCGWTLAVLAGVASGRASRHSTSAFCEIKWFGQTVSGVTATVRQRPGLPACRPCAARQPGGVPTPAGRQKQRRGAREKRGNVACSIPGQSESPPTLSPSLFNRAGPSLGCSFCWSRAPPRGIRSAAGMEYLRAGYVMLPLRLAGLPACSLGREGRVPTRRFTGTARIPTADGEKINERILSGSRSKGWRLTWSENLVLVYDLGEYVVSGVTTSVANK